MTMHDNCDRGGARVARRHGLMPDRQKAEVLCWVAHLFSVEADEVTYRWPPATPLEQSEASRLYDERERIAARAEELACVAQHSDEATRLWREALARFTGAA